MKNVSIDTCVFFNILHFEKFFFNYGRSSLTGYLASYKREINELKKDLLKFFPDDFLDKHSDLSFAAQLDKFDYYASRLKKERQRLVQELGRYQKYSELDEMSDSLMDSYEEIMNRIADINKTMNKYNGGKSFTKLKVKYFDKYEKYYAGLLFEKCLKGEVKLHIVKSVYQEILNFVVDDNSNDVTKKDLSVKRNVVDRLLKDYITLINVKSDDVKKIIADLAEKYRTPIDGSVSMDGDINSLGFYGDSSIMAESNLAGMPLITMNTKDFIKTTAVKDYNDLIRQHIRLANYVYYPLTSDAEPCTLEEYMTGNYHEPTRKSESVGISKSQNTAKNCRNIVELSL